MKEFFAARTVEAFAVGLVYLFGADIIPKLLGKPSKMEKWSPTSLTIAIAMVGFFIAACTFAVIEGVNND